MKKLLSILLFATAYSFANPPLLLRPNAATINLQGTPTDTAVTLPRLLMIETITYSGQESTFIVSFAPYVNLKEYRKGNSVNTNVPLNVPKFKVVGGSATTINNILQQARQYYIGLGYLAAIQ